MRLYLFKLVQGHNSKPKTYEKTNRPIAVEPLTIPTKTYPRKRFEEDAWLRLIDVCLLLVA